MTAKTISSSSSALTLTGINYGTYNPLSITSVGTVSSSSVSAIYSNTALSWVIINSGTIESTKSTAGVGGIVLKQGGTITNNAGGIIEGELLGAYVAGSAGGSIVNGGLIKALAATGVGVKIAAAHVTLVNYGSVAAGATNKDAVTMSGSGDVLMLEPGFAFTGNVVAAASDTLALAGTASATLSSLGTSVSGFGTTTIESGAIWTLTGAVTDSLVNSGTLSAKSTLKFTGAAVVNNAVIEGGELNLYQGGNTLTNNGGITGATTGTVGAVAIYQGAITNNGTIAGVSTNLHSSGIQTEDATISNGSLGVISGAQGIYDADLGQSTLLNAGTVTGTAATGLGAVALRAGGSVSNAPGGLIQGTAYGVFFQGSSLGGSTAGFVNNQGSISGSKKYGIYLGYGGTITNAAGGRISGAGGVQIGLHAPGTLVNTGTVIGTKFYGVELQPGNTVINTTSGTAAGYIAGPVAGIRLVNGGTDDVSNTGTIKGTAAGSDGILLANTTGTIANGALGTSSGVIAGTQYGIQAVYQPSTVTNFGTVEGATGFYAKDTFSGTPASNTIINAGTIASTIGGTGTAIQFGQGNDRLVVDPGAVFVGLVDGSGGSNTLELTAGAGTLYALGSRFTNFQTLLVDAGGQWSLTGTPTMGAGTTIDFAANSSLLEFTPGDVAATIDGFVSGDTIGLTGVADATGVSVVNTNTLEVTRASESPVYLTLDPTQTQTSADLHYATQDGSTFITTDDVACFAEDTRIETVSGPVRVQDLRAGDMVRTASGKARPVRWVGWRRLDLARHPMPDRAQPIRIRADAVADGVPCRDLRLSPDHAVPVDDVLVPVRLLVNGASILREAACRHVIYYHIELDAHDILLAEGLPAESYLDTGNRAMFENAGLPIQRHPGFDDDQARRVALSCAPFTDDPARMEPIWQRLAARAARLGYALPPAQDATDDPDLHLRVGGRDLRPLWRDRDRHIFLLPSGTPAVHLRSRHAAPCNDQPWLEDRRQLGVMVRRLTLRRDGGAEIVPLDDPSRGRGWWAVERDGGGMWCWTDGEAELRLPDERGGVLEVEASGLRRYRLDQSIAMLSDAGTRAAASRGRRISSRSSSAGSVVQIIST